MRHKVEGLYKLSIVGPHAGVGQRKGLQPALQGLSRWSGIALAAIFLAVVGISGCNDSTECAGWEL